MIYKNEEEMFEGGALVQEGEKIIVKDEELFRRKIIDNIVDTILLGNARHIKKICYWIAYEAARQFSIFPSSILGLYQARGRGEVSGFTVPAINLRTLTYDLTRAILRSAQKINASALIFEIARNEMIYTFQRPVEYTSVILLAAIKENYSGPIFFQGDHFQTNPMHLSTDREREISDLKKLIKESLDVGFYNIDIDTSTLSDLQAPDANAQQKNNYLACAHLISYIRSIQPADIEISIGGEIGELNKTNSNQFELHGFLSGLTRELGAAKGISKLTIQTGAITGGIPLPDGTVARVNIDFDTLHTLSDIARQQYALAGCVQHGASTLPNEAFHHFPESNCAEVHLGTQFQNIVYDYMPIPLKEKIYDWLHKTYAHERLPGQTNDQFIYLTRKYALGPFKKEIFSLSRDVKNRIAHIMEEEFDFLFDQLNIKNTRDMVNQFVKPVAVPTQKNLFSQDTKDMCDFED